MLYRIAALPLLLLPLAIPFGSQDTLSEELPVLSSAVCSRCHSNRPNAQAMRDELGNSIAPFDLWSGTMMANSARDPLWRAVVSAEIAATPAAQHEIESTCMRCHTPMADEIGLTDHTTGSLLHLLDCDSDLGQLAQDGVSCTICHGMKPDNLGTEESYSGGFELNDERRMYGPHKEPFTRPMGMMAKMVPTFGEHVTTSAACGTCHTLETEALDENGHAVGATLVEQAPYLEWLNSSFNDEIEKPGAEAQSCQDCHMPTSSEAGKKLATNIARHPRGVDFGGLDAREPFGRHVLVGGNTLVLGILRDNAEALGVTAAPEAFDAAIEATRKQLLTKTAKLSVEGAHREGDELFFNIGVINNTGHKFPTAHPIRRAWLRVTVKDDSGKVLFSSGAVNKDGRIVDMRGELIASEKVGGPIEPHRNAVTASNQVVTYESKMGDPNGDPTHLLLRGSSYLKDSRILPRGWSADHKEAKRTFPTGTTDDADFIAGGDTAHYLVNIAKAKGAGTLHIEADLMYQSFGARYAAEIFQYDTPEIKRMKAFFAASPIRFEVVASASLLLE